MNCQDCRERFGELLYASRGEPLDAEVTVRLTAHLRECAPCAGELRELQRAQAWLDVLRDQPTAAGVAGEQRPQVALYARLARLRRGRDAWRYAALAASAAAIVLSVAAWWTRGGSVDRAPDVAGGAAPAATVSPQDWGPEFQRLVERLDEQGRVLRLLAAELRAVEGRQGGRVTSLEDQAGKAAKATDLQGLRVAAIEHDIDKLREFLTMRSPAAQQSAD